MTALTGHSDSLILTLETEMVLHKPKKALVLMVAMLSLKRNGQNRMFGFCFDWVKKEKRMDCSVSLECA